MISLIDHLEAKEFLALNSQLQKKKNTLRKALAEKGILKREGNNTFDKYSYFSEAQYKLLFTKLFADAGLEISFSEEQYIPFDGTEKQSNGRMVSICFTLTDVGTGFFENTIITAEGIDKGDKAGYKAYTGALKYFLADTFMVATGDDAEKESPTENMNRPVTRKATPKQVEILAKVYTGDNLDKLLAANGIASLEDMPMQKASDLIAKLKERQK